MKNKELNDFERIIKRITDDPNLSGVDFEQITEHVSGFSLDHDSMNARIVMPYSGMGIFYFGVPHSSEMSADNFPKGLNAIKNIEFFKLNYCLSGRVEVFLKGKGQYAYLEEGMVAFDRNDTDTVLSFSRDNYRGFGLYFNFDIMTESERQVLSSFGITKEASLELINRDETCFLGNASAEFRSIVESLSTKIDDGSIDLFFARMQVTRMAYLLLHDDVIPLQKSEYTTAGQRHLAGEAENIILKDPGVHLTAGDIAARLNCTAPTLKKYFRKVYGVPMYTYLQNVRMERAETKLRESSSSIADIAFEVGYQNQSKFCSLFKKTYGVTPSEYRRLNS